MSACVVVGGNGFIGSHLVDELVARGHEVSVLDRFSGDGVAYRAAGVRRIVGDFLNRADLAVALRGQERVFHFLSTTTPASAEDDPTLDVRTNVLASVELFQLAVEARVDRVFFGSTGGAIYGDQDVDLMHEELAPRPVSPYAIGKLAIEGYLRYFRRKHGLDSVTFRVSNPYGPRQGPNKRQGVIPIFLHELAAGRPLSVFGDGSMERDFIAVSDAVRMMADVADGSPRHDLYNIGSGRGTTISELVDVIAVATSRDIAIEHRPMPSTFVDRVVLDTGRFRAEFGDPALIPLADGVRDLWNGIAEGSG